MISRTKPTNQLDFWANRVKYFWNKLPNKIKNCNGVKKQTLIKSNEFRKNGKKKNSRKHLREVFDELLNRI